MQRREEPPYKRDSVVSNHSSGIVVADNLMRRYPGASGTRLSADPKIQAPILGLASKGVYQAGTLPYRW